jgi:F-type H+-transporting ATPase subunit epsilon
VAIPAKLLLEIVTPDRALVREEVDEVQLPGAEGYFGVLPGHAPLLAMLKAGELWYRIGAQKPTVPVTGGFVEVLPDRVTVLAEVAESAGTRV